MVGCAEAVTGTDERGYIPAMRLRGAFAGAAVVLLTVTACGGADSETTTGWAAGSAAEVMAADAAEAEYDDTIRFDGYGPILIGMTADEVLAVTSVLLETQEYDRGCTALAAGYGADWRQLSVWIDDATGSVTGIQAPQEAVTDRGIGAGSPVAEVYAAYGDDSTIIEPPGYEGGEYLKVTPDDPSAGVFLAFGYSGDTVTQVQVGRGIGAHTCAPATR